MATTPNLPVLRTGDDYAEKRTQIRHNEMMDVFVQGFQHLITNMEGLNNKIQALVDFNIRQLELAEEKIRLDAENALEASRKSIEPTTTTVENNEMGKLAEALKLIQDAGKYGLFLGLGAALAGLRGWEGRAIARLKAFFSGPTGLVARIANGFKDIISGIRNLLIVPLDRQAALMGKNGIMASLARGINNIRRVILNFFGIGLDGKLIVGRNALGQFARTEGPFASIVNGIRTLFTKMQPIVKTITAPFRAIVSGLKGVGSMFSFLRPLGAVLKGIPIIGQIIGALFSLVEGVIAAFKTEGGFFAKMQAFFAAAISDFIGAPLDLLKSIISWVLGAFGFENAEATLDSFSIEDELEKVINKLFGVVTGAFEWIGLLFTDPSQAMDNLWNGIVGAWNGFGSFIFDNVINPIWNWFTGIFNVDPSGIRTVWEGLVGTWTDFSTWIGDSVLGKLWQGITDIFTVPEELKSDKDFVTVMTDAIDGAWKEISKMFNAIRDFDWLGFVDSMLEEIPGYGALKRGLSAAFGSDDTDVGTGELDNVAPGNNAGAGGAAGAQIATRSRTTGAGTSVVAPVTVVNTTNQNVDASSSSLSVASISTTSPVGSGDPFASTALAY